MNIVAVGRDRFQVQSLDVQTRPYLLGDVAMMPFSDDSTPASTRGGRLLRPLIEHYLTALEKSDALDFDHTQLPHDPLALAYLGAMLLQTEKRHQTSPARIFRYRRFTDASHSDVSY